MPGLNLVVVQERDLPSGLRLVQWHDFLHDAFEQALAERAAEIEWGLDNDLCRRRANAMAKRLLR